MVSREDAMTAEEMEIYNVLVERPEIKELFLKILSLPLEKRPEVLEKLNEHLKMQRI